MSRVKQFRLPDLGEGLTEGEILQWMVSPGDEIKLNQPIVEVETAKAAVEVPSPYAGRVLELHHAAGETVDVGSVIISVDTDPAAGDLPSGGGAVGTRSEVAADTVPSDVAGAVDAPEEGFVEPGMIGGAAPGGRTSVLVGYGPKSVTAKRRPRAGGPAAAVATEPATQPPPATPATPPPPATPTTGAAVTVLAKPPVRKLARELGVDLATVVGSGPNGTVSRVDVELAAAGQPAQAAAGQPYDLATRERRIPIKGVRKMTAAAMVSSAFTAPHVTEWLTIDMTPAMELRSRLAALPEFGGVKVSPLLLVAKALLLAVRRHPEINSTWDEAAQEIVVKDYVNLGIAAATPRGLVVPNIKDADRMTLVELARALADLTATAREGKTAPGDMQRGTITITNVGVFGVDAGTPIINPGESAILAFGAVRPMPWVHEGQIAIRQVTQLALSFDHRNVDGQLGSEVLADVGRVLSDPATALAWS